MCRDLLTTLIEKVLPDKKTLIAILIIVFCCIGIYMIYPRSNILSTPEYLEPGDLLFCDYKPDFESFVQSFNIQVHHPSTTIGPHNDHVAMYIGNDMFIEACPYFYDEQRGSWIGVVPTHIGTFNLWAENITFGVLSNVTKSQREAAVTWAMEQIGQPYQEKIFPKNADPTDNADQNSDHWFCSELIWASYLHQDIDLQSSLFTVTPGSLSRDDDILLLENRATGLWYPGMYVQWYGTCLFDYILDIIIL